MSDAACLVMALAMVAVVAVVIGTLALFFGRGAHVKGGGLEVTVFEPAAVPPPAALTPAPKPRPRQGHGKKGKGRRSR